MKTFKEVKAELNLAKANLDKLIIRHEKAVEKQQSCIRKLTKEFQYVCPHENLKEEEDNNYHTNTTWIEVICTDCRKIIRRY